MASPRPSGDVIDIGHTRDLKPGDHIYISGVGGMAWMKFGAEIDGVVTWVDTDGKKVGMRLPDGSEKFFDGGSKDELLRKLADTVSHEKVEIIRPTQAPARAPSASGKEPDVSPHESDARAMLMSSGLDQAAYRAYTTTDSVFKQLAADRGQGRGWYVYTVNGNHVNRIWKIIGDGSIAIMSSDLAQERGTVIPASEATLPSVHVIFIPRATKVNGQASGSSSSNGSGVYQASAPQSSSLLVGGLVIAGLAGVTWWILKNKRQDEDED